MNALIEWIMTTGFQAGAVVAAIITIIGNSLIQRRKTLRELAIARMQVATSLKFWLAEMQTKINNVQTYISSHGAGGEDDMTIPRLAFEQNLDQIAALDNKTAKRLFSFLHRKSREKQITDGKLEFDVDGSGDMTYVLTDFTNRSASLFVEINDIHAEICKKLAWKTGVDPEFASEMNAKAEAFAKPENQ